MRLISESLEELYEGVDELYHSTLKDDYWKFGGIDKFPEYNYPGSKDHNKVVNQILSGMKKKYPDKDWSKIGSKMKDKISAGIS